MEAGPARCTARHGLARRTPPAGLSFKLTVKSCPNEAACEPPLTRHTPRLAGEGS